jgi:hypothetical protein
MSARARKRQERYAARVAWLQTLSDQQVCSSFASKTSADASPKDPEAKLLQTPRSEHTCPGYWKYSPHSRDTRWRAQWRPSRSWDCPACREWLVDRDVTHILGKIDGRPVWATTITAEAWRSRYASMSRAAKRAGQPLEYQRIPQPGGLVLVIASAGTGAPIPADDVPALLEAAYQDKPPDTQVTASTSWQLHQPNKPAAQAAERPRGGWLPPALIGSHTAADLVRVAKRHDAYIGTLPDQYEAHELARLTPSMTLELGLRRIDGGPLERWREAA